MELEKIKEKIEYYEQKREEIMAALNSVKGQKEMLESQKEELTAELLKVECKNSKELEAKINQLKSELDQIKIEIPDDILCNLQ